MKELDYQPKIQVKKDYYRQRFINPYFSKDKKSRSGFNTKFYLKILAAIFLIYLVVYSDLFRVKGINVSGTDMIGRDELTQAVESAIRVRRWYLLPQDNLIFLSKQYLSSRINKNYSLNKLEINKHWQSLEIKVEEKVSYLMIFNRGKFYFTDAQGNITREISTEEAQKYWNKFPILNTDKEQVDSGSSITSEKIVNYVLAVNNESENLGLEVKGYEERGTEEIALVAKPGWRAYLSLNVDAKKSVENLNLVLKEKIKDQKSLEYIDLRFGDKVYYK